jgi:hypothetical protein
MIETDFWPPYRQGSIAGLPPDRALEAFIGGDARPVTADGKVIPLDVPTVVPPREAKPTVTVEIPDNWPELHHLQKLRLAKEIRGVTPQFQMTKEEAEVILAAEVEQRRKDRPS